MVTLPGGRFWSFCCCAAVLGVITLKPEATSIFSLFWVAVCVVAQPANAAAHPIARILAKVSGVNVIVLGLVVDFELNFLRLAWIVFQASEGNPRGDLRPVHNSVETETVVLIVTTECPI